MIEKSKKQKRGGIITEKDVSTLLNRYSANTVLKLLQEVGQSDGVKIDWDSLVKNTATGITNVREYRMLWRHLAYRFPLPEHINEKDSAEFLDDDSDLEFEVEAFPDVSGEAVAEAAACVKVLAGFGRPSDSSHPVGTTVEAPLTINIPNGKATAETMQPSGTRGTNIYVPVTLQKHLLVSTSAQGTDASGSARGTNRPKKRRKTWTQEEDMVLTASVKRHGEGNWDEILKNEFKGDVDAEMLSQRWAVIKKKLSNFNKQSNSGDVQRFEATRHAMNLALNPPAKNTIASSSDPVRAAAIAAGARIATQTSAASLHKPAIQPKNAFHIRPGPRPTAATSAVAGPNSSGLASTPVSSGQGFPSNGSHPASVRPPPASMQNSSVKPSPASNQYASSERSNDGSTSQHEVKTAASIRNPALENATSAAKEAATNQLLVDGVCVAENEQGKQVWEIAGTLPKQEVESRTLAVASEESSASKVDNTESIPTDVGSNQAESSQNANGTVLPVKGDLNPSVKMETDDISKGDKLADSSKTELDNHNGKLEAVIKSEPEGETTNGKC